MARLVIANAWPINVVGVAKQNVNFVNDEIQSIYPMGNDTMVIFCPSIFCDILPSTKIGASTSS